MEHIDSFGRVLDWGSQRSAVGNMSDYSYASNCSPMGREFDLCPVHTYVEIDPEIISSVILLPSTDSFKKGCCHLQAKVCV